MEDKDYLLLKAAAQGNIEVVRKVLEEGVNINAVNPYFLTALRLAAHYGHKEIVEFLIKKGVDLNTRDDNVSTAIRWAASYGFDEIAELLLDADEDTDIKKSIERMLRIAATTK